MHEKYAHLSTHGTYYAEHKNVIVFYDLLDQPECNVHNYSAKYR